MNVVRYVAPPGCLGVSLSVCASQDCLILIDRCVCVGILYLRSETAILSVSLVVQAEQVYLPSLGSVLAASRVSLQVHSGSSLLGGV